MDHGRYHQAYTVSTPDPEQKDLITGLIKAKYPHLTHVRTTVLRQTVKYNIEELL